MQNLLKPDRTPRFSQITPNLLQNSAWSSGWKQTSDFIIYSSVWFKTATFWSYIWTVNDFMLHPSHLPPIFAKLLQKLSKKKKTPFKLCLSWFHSPQFSLFWCFQHLLFRSYIWTVTDSKSLTLLPFHLPQTFPIYQQKLSFKAIKALRTSPIPSKYHQTSQTSPKTF